MAQLGSNPWVNGFIAALFIAFSFSLLGAFEITVPSSLLTRLNKSSEGGGVAGTLLMGLTFSLASFSCVGPFVGTLLAASVTGGAARPAVGMVTFASGLALPFFMLALFPSYLKRLPKSGGWMARVKVVMGFIILAASLKYLSSVDQVMQWGVLTRERFLAVWVVLFSLAGLYLLGFVRLEGVKPDERLGLARLLCGVALVAFGISLLPGMFGGRLGELEGFVPEPSVSSLSARGDGGGSLVWMKNDYRGALERAKSEGKPLFISFTGYACTNCHWMKANMLSRPEIVAALKNFVLLELYTDGTDAASEANAQLQLARFQSSAIPLYAILGPDERVIASSAGLTRDAKAYLAFLSKGQGGAVPGALGQTASAGIPPLKTLSGGKLDTAPLAGKVVVLNFWATWCVPCAEEIPAFNKVYKDLSPQGVALIGASADDEGPEVIQGFLKKHPIDYTVARVTDEATQAFELDALPMTVIFNRQGREVKRFSGAISEAALRAAVQNAL
jgi:thiol:disulfide interchange protein DsbD